jgi:methyl-accepting chemotaxis protein
MVLRMKHKRQRQRQRQRWQTMEVLVISVKQVADIMREISAASQDQSAGIERVHQVIAEWTR